MRREYEACGGLAWVTLGAPQKFAPFTWAIRGERVWRYISDIFVPERFRRQGVAADMLTRCLADADREGISLWLIAAPRSSWDLGWLTAFYARHGFNMTDVEELAVPRPMQRQSLAMWRHSGGTPDLSGAQPSVQRGRRPAVH